MQLPDLLLCAQLEQGNRHLISSWVARCDTEIYGFERRKCRDWDAGSRAAA